MEAGNSAVVAQASRRDLVLPQIAVAYFLALKLAYAFVVPPNRDEAYYWTWGEHLQWSYLDHAPLVGWASGAARMLLGSTPIALHLPALVTFLILVYALARSARWLAPEDPARHFWVALAIFCASPLLNVLTTLNFPDHLLICFSTISLLSFGRYLGDIRVGGEGKLRDLYLGALFLGLAGLSKYNAVFISAGLVIAIALVPQFRRLLRSPHLYLAALLTGALTAPVLVWNLEHRFVSLVFHSMTRFEHDDADYFDAMGLVRVLLSCVVAVSPFLMVGLMRFLFGRVQEGRQGAYQQVGRWTALVSTLVFLPLAAWSASSSQVSAHWMVMSFLPFVIVAPLFIRKNWVINLHLGWGALVTTLLTLYYLIAPLATAPFGIRDGEAAVTFGQDQLAVAVRSAAEQHGVELFGAGEYGRAARLAFALGTDRNIIDLGRRTSQFDLWREGISDAGKDVIFVTPGGAKPGRLAEHFDSVEDLGQIAVERLGYTLATYQLYLGHSLKP